MKFHTVYLLVVIGRKGRWNRQQELGGICFKGFLEKWIRSAETVNTEEPAFPWERRQKMEPDQKRFRVIITGNRIAEEAMQLLEKTCIVECTPSYLPPEELVAKVAAVKPDALLVRVGKITRAVLQASPNLRVVAKHGIGVDITAATELKIPVLISASANFESVAEHALGLMLALAKDIPYLDGCLRAHRQPLTGTRCALSDESTGLRSLPPGAGLSF